MWKSCGKAVEKKCVARAKYCISLWDMGQMARDSHFLAFFVPQNQKFAGHCKLLGLLELSRFVPVAQIDI